MVSVDRTSVWPFDRRAVGIELVVSNVVWEFFSIRMEIDRYPTNVVFGGIGMSDFFAKSNLNLEHLICIHCIRALDDWDMFLCFPIGFLNKFSNFNQNVSSLFLFVTFYFRTSTYIILASIVTEGY